MLKKLIRILIEFSKKIFIVIIIFSFWLIIIFLFKYNVYTLLNPDFNDATSAVSLGSITIPKTLVVPFLLLIGILIVLLSISIIFQDYFKKPKK
jgi:Sec-independent protein secretion pathway component TatC